MLYDENRRFRIGENRHDGALLQTEAGDGAGYTLPFRAAQLRPEPPLPASILAKVLIGYNRDVDPTGFLAFDRRCS